ncbi:MAG TPA: Dabb family protein [Pirellulales bacterium]|jgi:hypothetical protein
MNRSALMLAAALVTAMFSTASGTDRPADAKILKHVVLFKFKDSATPDQVAEVVRAFKDLKNKIDVIVDFEYGTDVSTENRAQGFTHCFLATFKDDKARDTYLVHPQHMAFGSLVGPRLDKVLVVDFWVQK